MPAVMQAHLGWKRWLQEALVGAGVPRQQLSVLRLLAGRA